MIDLPTTPAPAVLSIEPVDFGGVMGSPLGGSQQRINRVVRWAFTVTMPPLTPEQAREWAAALVEGVESGVRWPVFQVGLTTGSPGSTLVNGGSQSARSLICNGATPGYSTQAGQVISIVTGGNRYCYMIASPSRADASGNITLNLTNNLRAEPADNDVVEIGLPKVEGLLASAPSWIYNVDQVARGFTFTISEIR